MLLPTLCKLPTLPPSDRCLVLPHLVVATNRTQRRLEGRSVLKPDLDLSAYHFRVVFDWIEFEVHLGKPTQAQHVQSILRRHLSRNSHIVPAELGSGDTFTRCAIKIQDPPNLAVIAQIHRELVDTYGETAPSRVTAIEVSVDAYPLFYWYASVTVVDATVPDVIRFFGTYYVWVLIALNFVTLGVVMPVLTDVSQMLGAIPISRAAFVGLTRPKGHPFKVTAKGGDRSQIIVQWSLLAPFAVILGLTLIGLVLGIFSDSFAFYDAGDGKAIVLFWTLYNVVVLCFTILVCVELPRRERHIADSPERALMMVQDMPDQEVWLVGLAQDRVRIRGAILSVGVRGRLRISDVGDVEFLVNARTTDGARLSLHPDEAQHTALLERFYTDGEAPGVLNVKLAALIEGISRRLSFNADRH